MAFPPLNQGIGLLDEVKTLIIDFKKYESLDIKMILSFL